MCIKTSERVGNSYEVVIQFWRIPINFEWILENLKESWRSTYERFSKILNESKTDLTRLKIILKSLGKCLLVLNRYKIISININSDQVLKGLHKAWKYLKSLPMNHRWLSVNKRVTKLKKNCEDFFLSLKQACSSLRESQEKSWIRMTEFRKL